MKNKHSSCILYGVAVTSTTLSAVAWTVLLSFYTTSQSVISLEDFKNAALPEVKHFSAPEYVASVLERNTQTTEKNEETKSELTDWKITYAYKLSLPTLAIEVPVYLPAANFWNGRMWDLLEEQMQVGLTQGAVAYPHSVPVGVVGSIFIAGHSSPPNERAAQSSYGRIFERLPEAQQGDVLTLQNGDTVFRYVVERIEVVPETETSILEQDKSGSVLKLITCFPIGTTKDRLVVTAKLIDPMDEES
jgi:LPXTG-site transpeptidase (sortase) family protein